MATNGNNILIYKDGSVIAATKSNEMQTSCDTIEISSSSQGVWRQYLIGRKDWSVTTNFLVPAASNVWDLLRAGESCTVAFYARNGATLTKILEGSAFITNVKITATRGNLAQGSFSFKGNGPLNDMTTTT